MTYEKKKYSKIYMNGSSDVDVNKMAKEGNESIKGLLHDKNLVIKKKGYKK